MSPAGLEGARPSDATMPFLPHKNATSYPPIPIGVSLGLKNRSPKDTRFYWLPAAAITSERALILQKLCERDPKTLVPRLTKEIFVNFLRQFGNHGLVPFHQSLWKPATLKLEQIKKLAVLFKQHPLTQQNNFVHPLTSVIT